MKIVFKSIALLLLALWLPATAHCDMEAAGIQFFAPDTSASECCDEGCTSDICHFLEGNSFTKDGQFLRAATPAVVTLCTCLLHAEIVLPAPDETLAGPASEAPPAVLRLHRTWSFTRRTALPARAPNCIA